MHINNTKYIYKLSDSYNSYNSESPTNTFIND